MERLFGSLAPRAVLALLVASVALSPGCAGPSEEAEDDGVPLVEDPAAAEVTTRAAAGPRVIYLQYTEGSCRYGTFEECKRKLQDLLDKWYADFNVVFTHTMPDQPPGQYYLVRVKFNGGGGGLATTGCKDQFGSANSFAEASVGSSLVSNAGTIAQENGHNVGLGHTTGATDVMNQRADNASAGFSHDDNATYGTSCRTTQNSYALMLERLGAWPGGCKPGPYGEFCPGGATPGAGGTSGAGGGAAGSSGNAGGNPGMTGGAGVGGGNAAGASGSGGGVRPPGGPAPGTAGGGTAGATAGVSGGGRAGGSSGAGASGAGSAGSSGGGAANGGGAGGASAGPHQDSVGSCSVARASAGASGSTWLVLGGTAVTFLRRRRRRGAR